MATLSVQTISRSAITPSLSAAAGGGDAFNNSGANKGRVFFWANNASGGDITVTFVTQSTVDGQAVTDRAVVVEAGTQELIGPFQSGIYNDGSDLVQVTYSGVTSLTVGAFNLTPTT